MNLVFIYGPPGVGKFTVATELAELTGYKLFHNHQSIDAVRPVFTFGDEPFARLVHRIRLIVLEEAAREGVNVIFTFVYASKVDDQTVAAFCEVVERHGGQVQFVRLTCASDVLEHRVQRQSRSQMGKLTDIELVRELHASHDLLSPVHGRESVAIDNSDISPRAAAQRIASHYGIAREDDR
jgi:predicted kinase